MLINSIILCKHLKSIHFLAIAFNWLALDEPTLFKLSGRIYFLLHCVTVICSDKVVKFIFITFYYWTFEMLFSLSPFIRLRLCLLSIAASLIIFIWNGGKQVNLIDIITYLKKSVMLRFNYKTISNESTYKFCASKLFFSNCTAVNLCIRFHCHSKL